MCRSLIAVCCLISFCCATTVCCLLVPSAAVAQAVPEPETIEVGDRDRLYLLYDFAGEEPAPLVIVLHGGGGNGENAMQQTGFNAVAERERLVVAYPYGSGRSDQRLLTWNAGHCCAYAMQRHTDDVAFIESLIDHLIAGGRVDPARVYVTGLSNGGMLAHRLALAIPDRITAIAPVIASLFGDEPEIPVDMPVLMLNGADDQTVRVEGGELRVGLLLGNRAADRPTVPVLAQARFWAARNACGESATSVTDSYEKTSFAACRTDASVELYVVRDNGHAWPGGAPGRRRADDPTQGFDANEAIWAFFSRF